MGVLSPSPRQISWVIILTAIHFFPTYLFSVASWHHWWLPLTIHAILFCHTHLFYHSLLWHHAWQWSWLGFLPFNCRDCFESAEGSNTNSKSLCTQLWQYRLYEEGQVFEVHFEEDKASEPYEWDLLDEMGNTLVEHIVEDEDQGPLKEWGPYGWHRHPSIEELSKAICLLWYIFSQDNYQL